jgi:tripartite-type tricarboxylate transporter receptor subunit TctC
MVNVPYRGGALTDLLGGQVQVMFSDSAAFEHIRAGKPRPLAVTSATRSQALPDVPTVGEFVPDYEAGAWIGVDAPIGIGESRRGHSSTAPYIPVNIIGLCRAHDDHWRTIQISYQNLSVGTSSTPL